MPWVRLDDRFPSHRKVALLSDRAFRLYVSGLCWASENLTEGRILDRELALVSRVRGVKAAAKELEDAKLWDRVEGGWSIHDYLEYNPDRARVQADRLANAARQKSYRERRRAERNAPRNGVTPADGEAQNDTTATRPRHDRDTTATGTRHVQSEEPQVNAFRNGVTNGTPSPSPSQVPPTEEPPPYPPQHEQLPAVPNTAPATAVGPDWMHPLINAMSTAGMTIPWRFKGDDMIRIHNDIKRLGVPLMVDQARRAWQTTRTPIVSSRFFYDSWHALPTPPPNDGRPNLHAVSGPSKTSDYLTDMAAIANEMRAAGGNQ